MVHGEVQPSLENPIVRALEIPASSIDLAGNSAGDYCRSVLLLVIVYNGAVLFF